MSSSLYRVVACGDGTASTQRASSSHSARMSASGQTKNQDHCRAAHNAASSEECGSACLLPPWRQRQAQTRGLRAAGRGAPVSHARHVRTATLGHAQG
eukprot:3203441-Pleurochrysis_carterae.AAC.2